MASQPTHSKVPPQKLGFNEALSREANGLEAFNKALFPGGVREWGVG